MLKFSNQALFGLLLFTKLYLLYLTHVVFENDIHGAFIYIL